ncbi:interleukin-15 receptor subunit alpha isoform X2 [Labeo rohita]|uniref:interleukin-15 receptor subunit alpha isoform X2 n=1 Tax=Labeo rohita TaxID=84645 RepID=UPI0021E1E931|nr:interleukin-15 receptor subunit alpha isoform X2 [Labeo rohita]
MHMLVKLLVITAAYQHNLATASGDCGRPDFPENTVFDPDLPRHVGARIRIQCKEGYVREAGTSNLYRCIEDKGKTIWRSSPRLQCIRKSLVCCRADPKATNVPTTDPKRTNVPTKTQRPHQHFTSSTTGRTARVNTTVHGTVMPTTATGHIALTTTNEVVKTRQTTSQSTLMSTTKEAESITTNEITSTSSSLTSREYITTTTTTTTTTSTSTTSTTTTTTTTSSHTLSGSFSTTTGANVPQRTSAVSKGNGTVEAVSGGYKSTVGGVTGILILCLLAAVFLLCWRSRNQRTSKPNPDQETSIYYTPVPQSSAADKSTEDSESDKNQPQIDIASGADT